MGFGVNKFSRGIEGFGFSRLGAASLGQHSLGACRAFAVIHGPSGPQIETSTIRSQTENGCFSTMLKTS